jgi:hypothetical protein
MAPSDDFIRSFDCHLRANGRRHYTIPKVGIDLDGVVANFQQGLLDILTLVNPIQTYDWHDLRPDTLDVDLRKAQQLAREMPNFYAELPVFDDDDLTCLRDAVDATRIYGMFVATRAPLALPGRAGDPCEQSLQWLYDHDFRGWLHTEFDSTDKVQSLLSRGIAYHLDDDPADVEALRAVGIEAFLITRPWNEQLHCPYRVESIAQFLDIVAPPRSEEELY